MSYRTKLPPMSMLRAFDAYAQSGGVRRAASLLGVTHPIVSRHLKGLEAWLGVMLIDRKSGDLTVAGEEYRLSVQVALDRISIATERAMGGAASRLAIWCIPGLAYLWLTARIPRFSARYPSLALELRPTDATPNLSHHQADADIRWVRDTSLTLLGRGLRSVVIARPRTFPVARPDALWLNSEQLQVPADILKLPVLHEDSDADWRDWAAAQGIAGEHFIASARLWHGHMTLGAACEGQGVALTNTFLAADHLKEGRLIELGAGNPAFAAITIGSYNITASASDWNDGPVHWFREWLAVEAAEYAIHRTGH